MEFRRTKVEWNAQSHNKKVIYSLVVRFSGKVGT